MKRYLAVVCFALEIGAVVIAYFGGAVNQMRGMQQEAVDAGVAEWTVDAKGVTGFRWKGAGE